MYVLLKNNVAVELIPDINPALPGVPIEDRYPSKFLANTVYVEDSTAVVLGYIYNPEDKTFSEPPERPVVTRPSSSSDPEELTLEDRVVNLESENKLLKEQNEALSAQMDFYEECMVEMAEIVYA